MRGWARAFGCAVFIVACASSARAQTDSRLAVGADFIVRAADDPMAHGSHDVGFLWRYGHASEGWGWEYGLNWFATDLSQSSGSHATLGELHIRPFLGGYGYTHVLTRRTSIKAALLAGYALASFDLAASGTDFYRARLGGQMVRAEATNAFVAKPQIGVWYDLNRRVGLNLTAGYIVARPTVNVTTTTGSDRRDVRADMFQVRAGVVYSLF